MILSGALSPLRLHGMLHSMPRPAGSRDPVPRVERELQRYDPRTTSDAGLWVKSAHSSSRCGLRLRGSFRRNALQHDGP